jgi:hypothetical protein
MSILSTGGVVSPPAATTSSLVPITVSGAGKEAFSVISLALAGVAGLLVAAF